MTKGYFIYLAYDHKALVYRNGQFLARASGSNRAEAIREIRKLMRIARNAGLFSLPKVCGQAHSMYPNLFCIKELGHSGFCGCAPSGAQPMIGK